MAEASHGSRFEEFCAQVCVCLGVPVPQLYSLAGAPPGMFIRLRGTSVGIVQASMADTARGVFTVDFGAIPEGCEAEAYRSLLESNHVLMRTGGLLFGLDSANGHVVGELVFELEKANAIDLCAALRDVVASVDSWRTKMTDALGPPAVHSHLPADGRFA